MSTLSIAVAIVNLAFAPMTLMNVVRFLKMERNGMAYIAGLVFVVQILTVSYTYIGILQSLK